MNKIKNIRKLSDNEKILFAKPPTLEEIEAKQFGEKIVKFDKIIGSKKLTLKELVKFNPYPLLIKIAFEFRRLIENKNYDFIKFGYVSNYRFRHIERVFENISPVKLIYEFGSGGSTILIAEKLKQQFIKKGIKGILYTFDQSKEWLDDLKLIFPKDLLEFVNFNLTDIKYELKYNYRLLSYDIKNYHEKIDLVYIDGPTDYLFDDLPPQPRYHANGNIIEMMKLKNFRYAITDRRFHYFKVFKNNNFNNYLVNLDKIDRTIILKIRTNENWPDMH